MDKKWLTIKQLDKQLEEWRAVATKFGHPRDGWIKTIREALNMSVQQLANRLACSRGRIAQLEHAETQDATTLRTLKEAANALECEFVYAIIPKNGTSLESIIKTRAAKIANERTQGIAHTMALENQAVNESFLKNEKDELAKKIAEVINKNLWLEKNPPNTSLADAIAKIITENKEKKHK